MESATTSLRTRLRRVTRSDIAVAAVTLLLNVSTAVFNATKEGESRFTVAAFCVLVLGAVPLAWRRTFPVASLFAVGLAASVYGAADWSDPLIPFGVLVALAAVFEYSRRPIKVVAWTISTAAALSVTALTRDSDALDWWTAAFVVIAGPLAGDYLLTRRRLVEEATARVDRLQAERLHALADARAAERTRVARELHDVVAHHVTMLVVQAEAAASQPALSGTTTQASFDDLARSGRAAMNELRRLLGVLREGDGQLLTPQPTLKELDDLVAGVESSGVKVAVEIVGSVDGLPVAVDLAAYRIIQEGLTNVVKHAPGSAVQITITSSDHDLAVVITNDSSDRDGVIKPVSEPGVGLIGVQERVDLLGGTLEASRRALGGFRLEARLPVDAR